MRVDGDLPRARRAAEVAGDHFMRDEIVDADIGFSAEELDAYQFGAASPAWESGMA